MLCTCSLTLHLLGGGGLSSLRIDRQGKTYAQMVLSGVEVDIPAKLLNTESKL